MNPERWRQIEQIFQTVLELDTDQRKTYLEQAYAGGNPHKR